MKTLAVTSPYARGERVEAAQRRLAGENVFEANYQPGAIDGVFGEASGRACKRAKYWCGYPLDKMLPVYGDVVDAYLSGRRKLPPSYQKARSSRLAAARLKPLREKALARAVSQIGKHEEPFGSNRNPYGAWYGMNGVPWCAEFVTWCYVLEGSKGLARGSRYAYVPWIVNAARAGNFHLAITSSPQPGDLVCFDWDHDGLADHVGLYERDLPGDKFSTIEGNTSTSSDSNGGQVMRRERARSQVQAFVHVGA